MTSMIS